MLRSSSVAFLCHKLPFLLLSQTSLHARRGAAFFFLWGTFPTAAHTCPHGAFWALSGVAPLRGHSVTEHRFSAPDFGGFFICLYIKRRSGVPDFLMCELTAFYDINYGLSIQHKKVGKTVHGGLFSESIKITRIRASIFVRKKVTVL